MKFNRAEMAVLAGQPGHRFDKEGVMFVKERQEGFFRRNEICVERWCRLRGNLLFYFKSRDQWSEPAGVVVLENFTVQSHTDIESSTYGLLLVWEGGYTQYLGCHTHQDCEAWRDALLSASHATMRKHLESLEARLREVTAAVHEAGADLSSHQSSIILPSTHPVIDPEVPPLLECTFVCDNLLCDAIGRTPSTRLVVYVRNSGHQPWLVYGNTEIVERTSNPVYMVTITFRALQGLSDKTQIKIEAQDTRERFSMTRTSLGEATTSIKDLKQTDRLRLSLESGLCQGRGSTAAGFVTLTSWSGEAEGGASTESTPSHQPQSGGGNHRRTNSLPSAIAYKTRIPRHPNLLLLHSSPALRTYRFHSGLGGDISVMEIMAEPKFAFAFPQQLLSLWIAEEKELVHEIAGLGELKEPFHMNQMGWLENHLNLINVYSTAMEFIENYSGPFLKKSTEKSDTNLEFIPTNLHLQRMWVENPSLRKSGYYDIHTVGAFTAFAQKSKSEGLIRMLKELKSPQKDSQAWCSLSDRLQMAEDTLAAVRKVRREVVDSMRLLMKLAKERNPQGMFGIVEGMLKKTKLLCNISDTSLVEEAFIFLEKNRVAVRPEKDDFSDSVAEFMQRNRLKIDLQFRPSFGSLQTPNTEFISKELRTPDPDYFSPSLDPTRGEYWRGYSAFTSGYQSVDRLSDIDEFEESFRYMSIEDKTRHYYTLCRNATPHDTPSATPKHGRKDDVPEGVEPDEEEGELSIPIEIAKSETVFSENDSALESEDGTENSEDLSEEEEDDHYAFDENVYHNDNLGNTDEEPNTDEYGEEDDTPEQDDESTPHVGSETSKTQSPSSVGRVKISFDRDDSGETDDVSQDKEDKEEGDSKDEEEPDTETKADEGTEDKTKLDTGGEKSGKLDTGITCDTETSSHYRSGDEPEPIDLTHLNIEASMMCLASKVRTICGKANSPTLSNRTFRFRELDTLKRSEQSISAPLGSGGGLRPRGSNPVGAGHFISRDTARVDPVTAQQPSGSGQRPSSSCQRQEEETEADAAQEVDGKEGEGGFKIPDVPKPAGEEITDWSGEVRPSMRKLRQGMDSLLKSSRLVCSVLRLQQSKEAVKLTHLVKYRRDVCFSQALTSLVSALMARLWCRPPDPGFLTLLTTLGPLVSFEGLLSLHGEDVTIVNDMIVAVEDLRSVEFALVLVERRGPRNKSSAANPRKVGHVVAGTGCDVNGTADNGAHLPLISVSSFPLPRLTGSRNSLKVLLPVPDWVYSQVPLHTNMTFSVTPVFFNIGINQHATIAEKLGLTSIQHKNNTDNFRILADYVRRYKKLGLFNLSNTETQKRMSWLQKEQQVDDLISILRSEVGSSKSKNVDVLDLTEQIVIHLDGIRFTSCKSGKDRTGMAVSLEQTNILSREFDLADTEYNKALSTFRSEGLRRYNCEKNIGAGKYAFNSLQLTTFPRLYRPPVGTYGSTET